MVALVEAIHNSPVKLSMQVAGAGAGALAKLTQAAGCSRTLLRGDVLYSTYATAHALDYHPTNMVSEPVARQLAQHALQTAMEDLAEGAHRQGPSSPLPTRLLGVGATSTVQTKSLCGGEGQAFVSVWCCEDKNRDAVEVYDFHVLLPRAWTHSEQEEQVTRLLLHAIASVAGAVPPPCIYRQLFRPMACNGVRLEQELPALAPADHLWDIPPYSVTRTSTDVASLLKGVVDGVLDGVVFNRHGEARCSAAPFAQEEYEANNCSHRTTVRLLFPGSFHPLHYGHTELARAASHVVCQASAQQRGHTTGSSLGLRASVTFEIASNNADKGTVPFAELQRRVNVFLERGERVAVTSARLFVEKAALFPHHGFIVGLDTAKRILDLSYYEGKTEAAMVAALQRDIGGRGCYFVVGGRLSDASNPNRRELQSSWEELDSIHVPEAVQHLFLAVPERYFRVDVSSSELRARWGVE